MVGLTFLTSTGTKCICPRYVPVEERSRVTEQMYRSFFVESRSICLMSKGIMASYSSCHQQDFVSWQLQQFFCVDMIVVDKQLRLAKPVVQICFMPQKGSGPVGTETTPQNPRKNFLFLGLQPPTRWELQDYASKGLNANWLSESMKMLVPLIVLEAQWCMAKRSTQNIVRWLPSAMEVLVYLGLWMTFSVPSSGLRNTRICKQVKKHTDNIETDFKKPEIGSRMSKIKQFKKAKSHLDLQCH